MTDAAEITSTAARVYDQDSHSEADFAFLAEIASADREWSEAMAAANIQFGGGSVAWQAVKNLATRSRDAAYVRALATLEAQDDEAFLEAAE